MNTPDTPVLIAGGGPTGLTLAALLARQGVPALLVERRPGTSVHPRARGLNVRTMEILRGLGLEGAVRDAGASLGGSRYMLFVDTLAGAEIRRVPDEDLMPIGEPLARVTPCTWSLCAQDELEPLLLDAARQAGADVRFGTELVSATQDADGVTATVTARATGARETVRARYLVAADGSGSAIRRALGVPMPDRASPGRGPLGHFVNILFRADLRDLVRGRPFGICFVENPAAEGILLPVNDADRWLLNVPYAPEGGVTPADFTPARCLGLVRAAVGRPDLDVEVVSALPWEAAARVADRFRAGRVFLAGDAAHVMPPAGGLGLNTGVQDAHNLAWKLALALRGAAGPALLDTYEEERRPVAELTVDRAVREMGAPSPDATPDDGDVLAPILGYRYASAAVLDDGSPRRDGLDLTGRPGTRAPHVWLERDGARVSTLDLFDNRFVLLAGPQGAAWRDAARTVAARSGIDLVAYRIAADGDLTDPSRKWCAAYGVTAAGAVLVRPDGFVAWRGADNVVLPEREIERALLKLLDTAP